MSLIIALIVANGKEAAIAVQVIHMCTCIMRFTFRFWQPWYAIIGKSILSSQVQQSICMEKYTRLVWL